MRRRELSQPGNWLLLMVAILLTLLCAADNENSAEYEITRDIKKDEGATGLYRMSQSHHLSKDNPYSGSCTDSSYYGYKNTVCIYVTKEKYTWEEAQK